MTKEELIKENKELKTECLRLELDSYSWQGECLMKQWENDYLKEEIDKYLLGLKYE